MIGAERGLAQPPEGEREVGLVFGHRIQKLLGQRRIAVLRREQPEFCAQSRRIGDVENLGKTGKRNLGLRDGLVLVLGKQRQQAFRKAGQVPERDPRLVGVGIASGLVDRAEHGSGSYWSMKAHGP